MTERANVREFRRPIKEYDPEKTQLPNKVYFAPHVVGKPDGFRYEHTDELFQGWFESPL